MLSERIQRAIMGTILLTALILFNVQELVLANAILIFVNILIFIWAFFDFCPSLWTLKKFLKEG